MIKQLQTVNDNSSKRTKILTLICILCSIAIGVYLFGLFELGEHRKYQEFKSAEKKSIPDTVAFLYDDFQAWPDTVIVHGGQDGEEIPPPSMDENDQAQVSNKTDFYGAVDFWFDKLLKLIGALSPMVIAYLSYRKDMQSK